MAFVGKKKLWFYNLQHNKKKEVSCKKCKLNSICCKTKQKNLLFYIWMHSKMICIDIYIYIYKYIFTNETYL